MTEDRARLEQEVITAALSLAAQKTWGSVTMSDIAAEASLPLSDLHELFDNKQDILTAFARQIDRQILAEEDPALDGESARDRLFDVLMRRFDAMESQREAIRSISRDGLSDPVSFLRGLGIINESLGWMLEAANLDSSGMRGALRIRGLALIMAATLRVWLKDDTPDLSKTMAELDKRLSQADRLVKQAGSWYDRLLYRQDRPEKEQEGNHEH